MTSRLASECCLTEAQGSGGSIASNRPSTNSELARGKGNGDRSLNSREELFGQIDRSVDPIVVLDGHGNAVCCNEAFRAIAARSAPASTAGDTPAAERSGGRASARTARLNSNRDVGCAAEIHAWLNSVSDFRNMRVSAEPISIGGERMICFSILDVIEEHEGRSLGRAFLHDLLNAVGGIQMLIDLLMEGSSRKERMEYVRLLQLSLSRLLAGIGEGRILLGGAPVRPVCNVHDVLVELALRYRRNPIASHRRIRIDKNVPECATAFCDRNLLIGVLDNMMRSAIEDTGEGGTIELDCRHIDNEFEFRFKRSSSSKRIGKGLGTREFKLLSARQNDGQPACQDQSLATRSVRYPAANECTHAHTTNPKRKCAC